MADDGFNGSTISFSAGDQIPLRAISYGDTAAQVKVSGSADAKALYVPGQPDETITFDVVGVTALTTADAAAAVSIAWNDGSTDDFTTGCIVDVQKTGSEDGEILSSVTCKRAS